MIIVGMDVHVRNSFLHATDSGGRLLRRGRVGNSLAEVAEFLGVLEQQEPGLARRVHELHHVGEREGAHVGAQDQVAVPGNRAAVAVEPLEQHGARPVRERAHRGRLKLHAGRAWRPAPCCGCR